MIKVHLLRFLLQVLYLILFMSSLDNAPEIPGQNVARTAHIREYLQKSCKSEYILQALNVLGSFLKETCKELSDLLNRQFLQQVEQIRRLLQKSCKILTFLAFLQHFHAISCILMQYLAKSCKNFQGSGKFCLAD